MMDWGDGRWGDGMWGGGNWIVLLLSIAFLVAVIVGIVLVVRALSDSGAGGDRLPPRERETPEDLVRRRYAAGEIDREEYAQKLRDLGDTTQRKGDL
jgi:putative membrane protein